MYSTNIWFLSLKENLFEKYLNKRLFSLLSKFSKYRKYLRVILSIKLILRNNYLYVRNISENVPVFAVKKCTNRLYWIKTYLYIVIYSLTELLV